MNDRRLITVAVLAVVTYSVYMICHVLQGSLVPDGLILSGIIGFLGATAGIRFSGMKHEERVVEGHHCRQINDKKIP